jgi:hypothetical protein
MLAAPAPPSVLQVGATWAALRCVCLRTVLVAHADGVTWCGCGRGWRFVAPRVEMVV